MPKKRRVPGKLPEKFQGADVVRAKGMDADDLEKMFEERALGEFIATRDIYMVVEDKLLEEHSPYGDAQAFTDKADAIRYAQARGNGNVDHRVLRVTEQVLVIATDNEL
jgi:hypothetical protein